MARAFLTIGSLTALMGCMEATGGTYTGGSHPPPPPMPWTNSQLDPADFMNAPSQSQQTNGTPTYGGGFSCYTQ